MVFEGYVQDIIQNTHRSNPEEIKYADVSPLVNPQILFDAFFTIDQIDQNELFSLISESYSLILTKKFIKENKNIMARMFTNSKFVTVFTQVLGGIRDFTNEQKTCCNKFIYDYLILPHKKDKYIESLLYNLGMSINKDMIPILLGIGLSQDLSHNIAIARYSTDNQILAMKRVNVLIVNSTIEIMTEQRIINIYEKLFDHMMPMFEGIMFDKWDEELIEQDSVKEELYSLINLALLDILNDMPMDSIQHILCQYSHLKNTVYRNKAVRFDIHAISYDYARVIECIEIVEQMGNILPSI